MSNLDLPSDVLAWRKVCALVSGAALAPTADVLHRTGTLRALLASRGPVPIASVAETAGLHEGYAHVALGLLATQGLLERSVPEGDTRRARALLTPSGREWAGHAGVYERAQARMRLARRLRAALLDASVEPDIELEPFARATSLMEQRLHLHAQGPAVAAVVGALGRLGTLRRLYQAPLRWLEVGELGAPEPGLAQVLPLLHGLGWIVCDDDLIALTPEGRGAARWAPLFNYVYGYLRVYERAASLLCGAPPADVVDDGRDDSDRDLLLTGKAYVFRTGLRAPLEALLKDLWSGASPVPRVVVDMNAGDGTVLAAVAAMARSWNVGDDLTLVALVRKPLAERQCREALGGVRVAHRVLRADFSDPDEVASALGESGLRLRDALVVSKTTIHDRRFMGAAGERLEAPQGRTSEAVFVSPEGAWISPTAMEDDLAGFFARWRRHLGPHGLIAMDTHAVAPEVAACTWSENVVTHVAASHGYSSQYLIECDRFREAARRAGLSSRFRQDLGTDRVEAVTMSLDHFVP